LHKTQEQSPLYFGKNRTLPTLSKEEISWMGDHLETHSEIKKEEDSESSQRKRYIAHT